jgi:hypothetical protein
MTTLTPFIAPTNILQGTSWTIPVGWIVSIYTKTNKQLTTLQPEQTYVFNVLGEIRMFVQTPNGKSGTYRVFVEETPLPPIPTDSLIYEPFEGWSLGG